MVFLTQEVHRRPLHASTYFVGVRVHRMDQPELPKLLLNRHTGRCCARSANSEAFQKSRPLSRTNLRPRTVQSLRSRRWPLSARWHWSESWFILLVELRCVLYYDIWKHSDRSCCSSFYLRLGLIASWRLDVCCPLNAWIDICHHHQGVKYPGGSKQQCLSLTGRNDNGTDNGLPRPLDVGLRDGVVGW